MSRPLSPSCSKIFQRKVDSLCIGSLDPQSQLAILYHLPIAFRLANPGTAEISTCETLIQGFCASGPAKLLFLNLRVPRPVSLTDPRHA